MKKKNRDIISAANLPDEFKISDPRAFIKATRSGFLRETREQLGLTPNQAAEKLDITLKDLSRLESGNITESDVMALYNISELYDIDYHYLLATFKLASVQEDQPYGLAANGPSELDKASREDVERIINLLKEA